MKLLAQLRSLGRSLFHRSRVEVDLADELRFHMEQRVEHLKREGLNEQEATRRALVEFGPIAARQEECRDALGLRLFDALRIDLRHAAKQLGATPGLTITAVLSMALGIGACTAVYSVLHAVLIDTFPYRASGRLVQYMDFVPAVTFELWRKLPAFEDAVASDRYSVSVTNADPPENIAVAHLSPNAFEFFGIPPLLGRTFDPQAKDEPVAVLTYEFWQSHFGGSDSAIGTTLELDHHSYTVVGVAPQRLRWQSAEVFIPARMDTYTGFGLNFVGRLKPGATSSQAESQALSNLRARFQNLPADYRVQFPSLYERATRSLRQTLVLFLIAVFVLLAVAVSNVSILLLARGTFRQHELALRAAIGASRGRLFSQLLTESMLLTIAGGLLGAALAYAALHAVLGWLPAGTLPAEADVHLSLPVLAWSAATVMLTGVLAGFAPALRFSHPGLQKLLQAAARRVTGSRGTHRIQQALIAAQVAMTVVLLAGAGTAIGTLLDLRHTELGYDASNILRVTIPTAEGAYPTWEKRKAFFQAIAREVQAMPRVEASSFSPFNSPFITGSMILDIPGRPPDRARRALTHEVSHDYFRALRLPLLRGRVWTEAETDRAAPVIVINEAAARTLFPEGDAIGQQIRIPSLAGGQWMVAPPWSRDPLEVIGIVGNVPNRGLDEPPGPGAFIPYTLHISDNLALLVRTPDPMALVPALRQTIAAAAPGQSIATISTGEEVLREIGWREEETVSTLLTAFAGLALALAAIGLYSAIAYATATRTQEFGIRIALGASTANVIRLVLRPVAVTVASGVAAGIAASLAANKALASYTNVTVKEPWVFAAIVGVLAAVAMGAAVGPAWRAARTDPACNLRE